MDQSFARALQDLEAWDKLDLHDCDALTRSIAAALPPAFQFVGVETHQVDRQRHHIARFEWNDRTQASPSSFALIPGGTVTLGSARTQRPAPNEPLIREWLEYMEDGEVERDILPTDYAAFDDYCDSKLLPLRTVTLKPFLIETAAQEAGLLLPPPFMTYHRFKAHRPQSKSVTRITPPSVYQQWPSLNTFERSMRQRLPHRHVVAFLKHQGFRLPSTDQWEYACSGGSRSLFYWGDWEFAAADNASATYPAQNAFGLTIANNPYHWEYCDTPGLMRGGDGGYAFCGAEGTLAEYLPLASTFYCQLDEEDINYGVYPWLRRIFDLAFLVM